MMKPTTSIYHYKQPSNKLQCGVIHLDVALHIWVSKQETKSFKVRVYENPAGTMESSIQGKYKGSGRCANAYPSIKTKEHL